MLATFKHKFKICNINSKNNSLILNYKTFNCKNVNLFKGENINNYSVFNFNNKTQNFNFKNKLQNNNLLNYIQIFKRNLSTENAKYFAQNYKNDVRYQAQLLNIYRENKEYQKLIDFYHSLPYEMQTNGECLILYRHARHMLESPKRKTEDDSSLSSVQLTLAPIDKIPLRTEISLFSSILSIIGSIVLLVFFYLIYESAEKQTGKLQLFQDTHKKAQNVSERFSDVLGIDEIKDEILVYVEYLKDPNKFDELGAKLPRGILLSGEPGTGKTLIARAIAGEAGVPFYYTSGSSFDEVFVGLGSRRVRDLIEEARNNAPCIVFIDEIDSLGQARGKSSGKDGTLNQLLSELDGFDQKDGVIIIAATNLPERLDKALTRPGRFDRIIHVPKPDIKGRKDIIDFYLSKVSVADEIDTDLLAKATMGMTGAELSNMVNIAAIKAAKNQLSGVTTALIEEAFDDVVMGFERKTAFLTPEGKRSTAYHEAGHALCTYYTTGSNTIRKVTIVPRGMSLGMVARLPTSDDERMTRSEAISSIIIALGGRVGELVYTGDDKISTGASSDFQSATNLARLMALRFGMDERLGPVSSLEQKFNSPEKKSEIDRVIFDLIHECYAKAENIIHEHKEEHELLVAALEQYETITGEEVGKLIELKKNPQLTNEEILSQFRSAIAVKVLSEDELTTKMLTYYLKEHYGFNEKDIEDMELHQYSPIVQKKMLGAFIDIKNIWNKEYKAAEFSTVEENGEN